jgi:DNA repair protein RecO
MTEHFTWGIVLDKDPTGEADCDYSIFTWDIGKVKARATSSRKIISKLAGHLEPGTLASIRIVRKNIEGRFRIIEAMSEQKARSPEALRILMFAEKLIALEQSDIKMFSLLKDLIASEDISEPYFYAGILKAAGFDPDNARCGVCGSGKIAYFSPQDIMFLCLPCLEKRNSRPK